MLSPCLNILPAAQRELLPALSPVKDFGFVLYGGTAIALRLGHRESVDFDFFTSRKLDADQLVESLPFLRSSQPSQNSSNTFEVVTKSGVKVSFFGGLDFGRVGDPDVTDDGGLAVASLDDLMAHKLKVILQRNEAKDFKDIAAMCRAGVSVETGLAAAQQMFAPTFPPQDSLRAMTYWVGGDLDSLPKSDRETLHVASARVRRLPDVLIKPGLEYESDLPPI
jgi:hypothetical protein